MSDDSPVSNLIGILNLLLGKITLWGADAADVTTRRRGPARAAQGGEGANAAQRRAGAATSGAAMGQGRQGVPIRDR